MKRALPVALASLSVAVPLIPSVEAERDRCDSPEPTLCPLKAGHATDNRDIEPESPTPEPVTQEQVRTYSAPVGVSFTAAQ
jgi:hypothetical protein